VELCGELGMREAVPHLERRAFGVVRLVKDTCALSARIALARLGDDRAKRAIQDELASTTERTRLAAIIAAGRARLVEAEGVLEKMTGGDADLAREALALIREKRGEQP
jgi:HEAT repeat protein